MSAPPSSAVSNSSTMTGPANPSEVYGSSLKIDTSRRGASAYGGSSIMGASSPWRTAGEPGSPPDDTRSIASSTRSSWRRRGGPELLSATGERKELSQALVDLERMQQENKERMYDSARTGMFSPGDDLFTRSASTTSCRSLLRRRRWLAASSTNGAEGAVEATGGSEDGALASMPGSSSSVAVMKAVATMPSATRVPRLIETAGAEVPKEAMTMPSRATGVGLPLDSSSAPPIETGGPDGTSPRRSDLSMPLKGYPAATVKVPPMQSAAVEEGVNSNGVDIKETLVTATKPELDLQSHATPRTSKEEPSKAPVADSEEAAAKVAKMSSGGNPMPQTHKARGVGPQVQEGGALRRSSVPGLAREPTHATSSFTRTATQGRQSTLAMTSPLVQTYLARHTRAATAASPSPSFSLSQNGGHSGARAGAAATASLDSDVEDLSMPASKVDTTPVQPAPVAAVREGAKTRCSATPLAAPHPSSAPEKAVPKAQADGVEPPTSRAVDEDHDRVGVATEAAAGLNIMQPSSSKFTTMKTKKLTEHVAAPGSRRGSGDTSASTSCDIKVKRPARVVRQDLSVAKPVIEHTALHAQGRGATPTDADRGATSVPYSVPRDRPPATTYRERFAMSVSRTRPSASIARESRDPSHMRGESFVPRSSRECKSISVSYLDTAESSVARSWRESSITDCRMSEGARGASSGHLQRSTALCEIRRQQVLLDRQERERRSAAEERARLGSTMHIPPSKRSVLRTTSGLAEPKGGATATVAAALIPSKEKTGKAVVDQEEEKTVKPVHRPASATSTASAATTTVTASLTAAGRPLDDTTNASSEASTAGAATVVRAVSASTTTVAATPTIAAAPCHTSAAAAPLNGASAPETPSTPTPTPVPARHLGGGRNLTAGCASSSPALSQTRKPVISKTTLSGAQGATSLMSASGADHTATTAAAHSAMLSRTDTRVVALTANATETAGPTTRTGEALLSPFASHAQQHRTGGLTKRDITNLDANISSSARRAKRRVSTKLSNLTTAKPSNSVAPTGDKGVKPAAHVDAVRPSPAAPARQEGPFSVPAVVEVVAAPPLNPQPAPAGIRPAPFCVECGQRHVDDAAKFCAVCGHKRVFI
ncbi:hypothetical protein ABL78_5069 [Leptomonas seymouri]|uniref:Uncharacterized protein n=1 Tax=Leptomonas seymouri TaxID=5684 RepID=A0A0N1I408_LEPSE|nr:hypothetical protein ABL78_5069 [Leptomonas seymouri]|eukprot:KPI85888.1 hypothetical protein ABL78_5069 [Leptomonas seymouri]